MPVPTAPPPRPARGRRGRRRPQAQAPPRRPRPGERRRRRRGTRQSQPSGQRPDQSRGGRGGRGGSPVQAVLPTGGLDLDDDVLEARRGRERKGRPVGRYLMCVHVDPKATQISVLEGRNLIEHYISRPSDDVAQIHGNIYLGKVQNVLPGMEAAFVDIGTPKNAVLYRGDVHFDADDVDAPKGKQSNLRIEQMLQAKQTIICQVTKNPIGAKGARLTQEVSLPGPLRGADPEQLDLRHLQAPVRRRAQAAPQHPRSGEAQGARRHRPHGGGGRHRPGDRARRPPAARPVGPDRRARQALAGTGPAVPRARHGGAGDPRGAQQRLPRRRDRRPRALRVRARLRVVDQPGAGRPRRAVRPGRGGPSALRALPHPRAAPQGPRPQGVAPERAARSSSSTPRRSR